MTIRETRLLRREDIAERTSAFHFARPQGFAFEAGQAIDLVLPGRADGASRHTFSLVSAPFENELVVATRMRESAFKRALALLAPGAYVGIDGPFGSLALHTDVARPALFVAGGIGITPFVSMLRQAAHDERPQLLTLLYSNRRPEDAAFLPELGSLERQHPRFRMIATMTGMAGSSLPWGGDRRTIDVELVRWAIGEGPLPIAYVAGPPAMVQALWETLNRAGVQDGDIRSENFFGY
jgi:ferredoxin-NADP reductase